MKNWPAKKIELKQIDTLIPYARNSRTHSDGQVAQIAASIKEWGWTVPILIDEEGGIIAGHGRVLAARQLGIKEIPVMVAAGWSEEQRRAYILADNQLALNAGWNTELLKIELADLENDGFNLDLIGFGEEFLADMLADKTGGLTDPDEVPDGSDDPITQLGDVWVLGKHRLVCGDSTVATDVEKSLNGVKPHLMVTDPPYGVNYDSSKARPTSIDSAKGLVLNDDNADWREAWALFPGDVAYVWHADLRAREVVESLEACCFVIRAQIIWNKGRLVMGRGHYHFQHEPCWYAVRNKSTASWNGDRKQSTVWEIDKPMKSETGHSTQKPVECMRRPIVNNSSAGQAVYDPFCGSGTTIIAAEMEGRCCHAIELSPDYCDIIVKRWQNFTGEDAVLDGDGESFNDVEGKRETAVE